MLSISRLLSDTSAQSDTLRYGRHSAKLPAHLLHYSEDKKPVVVWTSTRRCNLHCMHCYTDSTNKPHPDELSTSEAIAMVDDLADYGSPVLLISGGEPLSRPDVTDVAGHAVSRGMRVVFSTNGTQIDEAWIQKFADIGISYVGISIDGRPETHDKFRGQRGAFDRSLAALEACRDAGIRTGLRFTITRANQQDRPWVFSLMAERNIPRLCVYHLAPSGRGARIAEYAPSIEETRDALDVIFDETEALTAAGYQPEVLTADNHCDAAYLWMRVAERQPEHADDVWRLLEWNGGNQSGRAIACIDAERSIYADQFWRWRPLGNVREAPFSTTWDVDPPQLLRDLRNRRSLLPQRCQDCRFVTVCNGNFRSRAEATTGDTWGADPFCYLSDEEVARVAVS